MIFITFSNIFNKNKKIDLYVSNIRTIHVACTFCTQNFRFFLSSMNIYLSGLKCINFWEFQAIWKGQWISEEKSYIWSKRMLALKNIFAWIFTTFNSCKLHNDCLLILKHGSKLKLEHVILQIKLPSNLIILMLKRAAKTS